MRSKSAVATIIGLVLSFSCSIRADEEISSDVNYLTSAQQVQLAKFITSHYPPLTNVNFSVAIGAAVPQEVALQHLSPEAEAISPKLHDVEIIVVEELIALVDRRSRRIVSVFPRWG
jgi:hypothetical protein